MSYLIELCHSYTALRPSLFPKIMNQALMVIQSVLGYVGLTLIIVINNFCIALFSGIPKLTALCISTLDSKLSVLFSGAATCTSISFSQAAWPDYVWLKSKILVQHFELQGRCFTNFVYYYLFLLLAHGAISCIDPTQRSG